MRNKPFWILVFCLCLSGCSHESTAEASKSAKSSSESVESTSKHTESEESSTDDSVQSDEPKTDIIPGQDDEEEITIVVDANGNYVMTDDEQASTFPSSPVYENPNLTYVNGILVVNKKHGVPMDYAPGVDPTAQSQCNALIADMLAQGLNVSWNTSNFRSYEYQTQLYNNYVAANGQAQADTFSARPGYSEHQTGLAFDLLDGSGQLLTSPAEAQWLLNNSWKYGFIVRYQAGKEAITGYQAEPWHIRYIGEQAQAIAQSGLTLEEYLGVEGGDYQ